MSTTHAPVLELFKLTKAYTSAKGPADAAPRLSALFTERESSARVSRLRKMAKPRPADRRQTHPAHAA
jgi:hypothetical protein